MSVSDQCRAMLSSARRDLKSLRNMLDPELHDDEIYGFHAQQAVEKALKSWIAFLDIEYPRTHDIMYLLEILEAAGATIEPWVPLASYTEFSVEFRYADWDDDGCHMERETMLTAVVQLISAVEQITGLSESPSK